MANAVQLMCMPNDDAQIPRSRVPDGFSIRKQRRQKPKPRRGTIPLQVFDPIDDQPFLDLLAKLEEAIERARQHLEAGETEQLEQAKQDQLRICAALDQISKRAHTVAVVPVRRSYNLHPAVLLAMHLLAQPSACTAPHKPPATMDRQEQLEVLKHFRRFFGVKIADAWIIPYLDLVKAACLDGINAQYRDARADENPRDQPQASAIPTDLVKRGAWVLDEIGKVMAGWPVTLTTPLWLDAPLTAFLVGRYGFDNGGGGRVVSRKTLMRLLSTPTALAEDLAKSPGGKNLFRATLVQLENLMAMNGKSRGRGRAP